MTKMREQTMKISSERKFQACLECSRTARKHIAKIERARERAVEGEVRG